MNRTNTFFLIIFLLTNFSCLGVLDKEESKLMAIEQEALNFEEVLTDKSAAYFQQPKLINAGDDVRLAYYNFMPSVQPQATLIFYHGGGMWSNWFYQKMAYELTQKFPVAVYLVDLRGHGNSGGPRGDAPSAQQVWQDIDDIVRLVKKEHPTLPLFLSGHSSGAGVVINYSGWQTSNLVDGYFLIAPFLGGDSETVQPNQRFIKNVKTWTILANILSGGWLFNHTKVVFFNYPERLIKQDLHIVTSYTTAMALATSPYDAKSIFGKMKQPCALFVGDQDEQFIPEKVIAFGDYLSPSAKTHSYAQLIAGASHLSIILEAPHLLAQALEKFVMLKK